MPKATRKGDIGSGHGCFPPSSAIEGSPDVFINGKLAVRVGDAFAAHGCGVCAPHGRNAAQGSATVNINGKPSVRVGDGINCGGSAATGSGNVFIGDLSWGGQESLPVKSKLRILLNQVPGGNDRPYTDEPYKLYKDGVLVHSGATNDEGYIEYEYSPPWSGNLEVETIFGRYTLTPTAMAPAETEEGLKQRLDALGYYNTDGQEANIACDGDKPQHQYFRGAVTAESDDEKTENLNQKVKPLMP